MTLPPSQVIDEIKVFTPQRHDAGKGTNPPGVAAPTTSSQESRVPRPIASPPVPPAVEERKASATTAAHSYATDIPEALYPAQEQPSPHLSKSPSPSSSPISAVEHTREPPRATTQTGSQPADTSSMAGAPFKDKQSEECSPPPSLQHQSGARIQLPDSAKKQAISNPGRSIKGKAIERSPVVPASPAREKEQGDSSSLKERATPQRASPEQRTSASEQNSTCPIEPSSPERVKNQQQQQQQRGSGSESLSPRPKKLPPGALLAPESREATLAWAATLEPSAAQGEGDSEKDAASSGSGSGFDIGWGKGWGIKGDLMEADNTEELLGTGWDPRRGVGERLMKAAEVRYHELRGVHTDDDRV